MTQLEVRPEELPSCVPEDLIEEARRRQKRRIRVVAISMILFALVVAATLVGLAGHGGGPGRSGSSHAQAPSSHPQGSGAPVNHATPNSNHATTAAPLPPPTSEPPLPLCWGSGLTMPPGALACEVTGIHPAAQASGPWGWTFGVTNAYSGIVEGQYITVYAGSTLAPDPTGRTAHGIPDGSGVRVTDDAHDFNNPQQFLLPGSLAPLTIKSVSGDIVTLQLPDGAAVTFNLATDTYS